MSNTFAAPTTANATTTAAVTLADQGEVGWNCPSNNVGDAAAADGANQGAERGTAQAARGAFALRQQSFQASEGAAQRDAQKIVSNAEKKAAAANLKSPTGTGEKVDPNDGGGRAEPT